MLVVIISSMTYRSIPAFTNYGINLEVKLSDKVVDTIGAGDVFLVITSLLYSIKSDQLTTNLIGNIAGALKVDIVGHSKSISNSNFYSILKHILK